MPYEVEIKARVADLEAIEARLAAGGGERLSETTKEDVYFAPEDAEPDTVDLYRDRVFRLRVEAARALVTFKSREVSDGVEVSDETEFEASDAAAVERLARHLGWRPFIRKRKVSRAWLWRGCRVELNRLDRLGDFVEVEKIVGDERDVPAARGAVRGILRGLGIADGAVEPRPYVDLLRDLEDAP